MEHNSFVWMASPDNYLILRSETVVIRCLMVEKNGDCFERTVTQMDERECGTGEIRIQVQYSSLNFKDALAATGHPGVARNFPHLPGIDAVGTVVQTQSEKFSVGEEVIVGHAEFGTSQFGGWAEQVVVPESWAVGLPKNMDSLEAIRLGTAGFTAAGCVEAMIRNGASPEAGPYVVSGATGGVGCFSVALLAQLGFEVHASTGKTSQESWLKEIGAKEVIDRNLLDDNSGRPLLSAKWCGGVDTVGSNTLGTMLRETKIGGVVAACGVVGGHDLPITVYPFILRGVALCGIDSANSTQEKRRRLWDKLSGDWSLNEVPIRTTMASFDSINEKVDEILKGKICGRVVLDVQAT